MRIFSRASIFLLFFGIFCSGNAQNIDISGTIINAKTKEPIPFANIALKEINKGTAANALGQFAFKVDSLPIDILFSHLSYEPKELRIIDNSNLIVELTPGKMMLDELVIKGKGNNKFAYNLVRKAFFKISRQKATNQYGKAFYRQISKNGDEYSELYEIFYDTKFSLNGVDDWAIQEGRYALKLSSADSFIYNKNFTLMVRLLTIVQPKTDDLIVPVSENVSENYFLTLEKIIAVNDRKLALISFIKKRELNAPAMEGELLIDVDSYHVLKIKGAIADDNLKFISLKGDNGSWKNYVVNCEITFKPVGEVQMALDYIKLEQTFDYYFNGIFTNKVETNSFFMYYEYYTPPKRKKLGGRLLRFNRRDAEVLDNIGYNQSFWDENIVVKRTPIEMEVISSFEEERAFGSIYINNKNQIILEDYELDKDPFIIQVQKKLGQYDLPRRGEKVYIHNDKPFYIAGDKMWFKAYIVNMATNLPTDQNDVLHVDLISPDGESIVFNDYKIENGVCYGQLDISEDLEAGVYTLRAYSGWMENADKKYHYHKNIEIFNSSQAGFTYKKALKDSINTLMYFPEGGRMIYSVPSQIGFIAKDVFGDIINIRGRLIDQNGRMISNVKSMNNLPGSIFLLPKPNSVERTMVMSHDMGKVNFPNIEDSGYSIMVNNLKSNAIDITIRGSLKLEGKKFYVLVISNGVLFDKRIGLLTRGLFKLEIPKSKFPEGIAQIMIVDEQLKIACKRLVYINQPEEVNIKYYQAKKEFGKREKIDFVLELKNEDGKPVKNANISISVLDRDKISRDAKNQNMNTYFKFGYLSDSNIDNIGDLVGNDDREALKQLDWVMLSQQSMVPDINSFKEINEQRSFTSSVKRGLTISGIVTDKKNNKPLSNGYLTIICQPDSSDGSWNIKTDQNGRFQIKGLGISNSSWAIVKAKNENGQPVEIDVLVEKSNVSIKPSKFGTEQVAIPEYGKSYIEKLKLSDTPSEDPSAVVLFQKTRDEISPIKSGDWKEIPLRPLTEIEVLDLPDYSITTKTENQTDNRSTIYWNPHLITNKRGRVKIGFYNSDEARNLQICVEGITQEGLPIFDIYEIGRDYKKGQPKK